MSAAPRPDAGAVSAALARRADALARELLSGGARRGQEWRVGSVGNDRGGSLAIQLSGPKAGLWIDHATGEAGDALDLVAAVLYRGNRKAAWRWSLAWLGHDLPGSAPRIQRAEPEFVSVSPEPDADDRRRGALRIYLDAAPSLAGTPAGAYLAGRGLDLAELGRQPRALRFHPALYNAEADARLPALVAAVSGADGQHTATHRTWLQQDGNGGWVKARLRDPKMSYGQILGGSIRLWRGASGKSLRDAPPGEAVVIGEGIETCLSIALACPEMRVLAAVSLGNMGRVALPPQIGPVILAADNDGHPKAIAALQRAIEQHLDAGRDVRLARSEVGKDFNDARVAFR